MIYCTFDANCGCSAVLTLIEAKSAQSEIIKNKGKLDRLNL